MLKIETDLDDICEIVERATHIAVWLTEMRKKGTVSQHPCLGWAQNNAQKWIDAEIPHTDISEEITRQMTIIYELIGKTRFAEMRAKHSADARAKILAATQAGGEAE